MPIFPHDGNDESWQYEDDDEDIDSDFGSDIYDSPFNFDGYVIQDDYPEDHHLDHFDYSEDLWNEY